MMREGKIAIGELLPSGLRSINPPPADTVTAPNLASTIDQSKPFQDQCQELEDAQPALHAFLETWGPHCGASRDTFRGHLVKMLMGLGLVRPPDLDLVMAYRFLYYCDAISMIPDAEFDKMDLAAKASAPPDHPIHRPGSDRRDDYTPAVRALALYIRLAYSKRTEALIDFEEPEDEEFETVEPEPPPAPKRRPRGGQAEIRHTGQSLF